MKKKLVLTVILTVSLLAVAAVAVFAMKFVKSEGTWGLVDRGPADPGGAYEDDADCLTYGDGPAASYENPNDVTSGISLSTNPSVQNGTHDNWNQVRYGTSPSYGSCPLNYPRVSFQQGAFNKQSGLAFRGAMGPGPDGADIEPLEPFLLGRMCHMNNQIYRRSNPFNMTYNDLAVTGVQCGPGQTLVADKNGTPFDPPRTSIDLAYRYLIKLEETDNTDDDGNLLPIESCAYQTGIPGEKPCPDAIIPQQLTATDEYDGHLYCRVDNETGNVLDYTIALLGFSDVDRDTPCPASPPLDEEGNYALEGLFVSSEGTTNCTCVWGMITDLVPSAVELNYFEAEGADEKIILRWETAFETENLGFNIYRSAIGSYKDAEKLNPTLIESLVPTGSTYGAEYEFVDATANPFVTYYYWLEDVDVNGETELHGPVFAEWID